MGIVIVDFDEMGQLLIIYFGFVIYLREKKKVILRQCIEFKEACDSVRLEVLYNIHIRVWYPHEMVRLIKVSKCNL